MPQNATSVPTATTVTILAVSALTVMANATIAPSLPGLATAFSDTPGIETLAGLVLSLPSLAVILTAALFGLIAGRIEKRRLLAGVLVAYALGGASGLVAQTMPQILAGRVLLGIAVGGTMTLATTYAGTLWTGPARARFMGWQAAAMSAGGIVFLLLGGLLAEIDWRGPFAIYLAALPLALAALWALPATPAPARRAGASAPLTPLLPLIAIAFFGMAMFYVIPTRLPFLLSELGIDAPSAAGLAIAALTTAGLPGALGYGRLRQSFSERQIFVAAFALMALGYVLIASAGAYVQVVSGTVVAGLGLGVLMPNQMTAVMARVEEPARARAAGLLTTAVFAGQFASPLLSGVLAGWLSLAQVFWAFAAALAVVALALTLARKGYVAPVVRDWQAPSPVANLRAETRPGGAMKSNTKRGRA